MREITLGGQHQRGACLETSPKKLATTLTLLVQLIKFLPTWSLEVQLITFLLKSKMS